MFELVTDVNLEINTGEKVEVFKLKRKRAGKKENKAFEAWKKKKEKEYANFDKLGKSLSKKERKLKKLNSNLEDVKTLLKVEDNKEKIKELIAEKRAIESRIEALESELELKQTDYEELEKKIEEIQEAAVLKSFELLIVQDEEAKKLLDFADEYGISVADLLIEINKQIKKDTEKK